MEPLTPVTPNVPSAEEASGNVIELDAFREPAALLIRDCVTLFDRMDALRAKLGALGANSTEIGQRERAYRERFNFLCLQIADREPRLRSSRVLKRVREQIEREGIEQSGSG